MKAVGTLYVIIGTITIMRARPTARLGVAGRPERAADIEHGRGDNCQDEKRLDIHFSLLHNLRSPFRTPHSTFRIYESLLPT